MSRYEAMSDSLPLPLDLIWRDDYENVPSQIRQYIDNSPFLSADDRQKIYQECSEEFLDIDQYAKNRSMRRPEVLHGEGWRKVRP